MIVATLWTACKKYDDGPLISLRSRSERVANNWRVEKAIDNGKDVSGDFDKYNVSLSKGGNAYLTAHYTFIGVEYNYATNGTWRFENNEEKPE